MGFKFVFPLFYWGLAFWFFKRLDSAAFAGGDRFFFASLKLVLALLSRKCYNSLISNNEVSNNKVSNNVVSDNRVSNNEVTN